MNREKGRKIDAGKLDFSRFFPPTRQTFSALSHRNVKNQDIPKKCNFFAMTIFHISIQQIVTDICRRALHPLDGDRPLGDVEVKRHKFAGISGRLPVELSGDVAPELVGLLDRLLVHFLVLLE